MITIGSVLFIQQPHWLGLVLYSVQCSVQWRLARGWRSSLIDLAVVTPYFTSGATDKNNTIVRYCGVLSKWEFFIRMRAASLAPILPRVMKEVESKQAVLILMKTSHFDRTPRYRCTWIKTSDVKKHADWIKVVSDHIWWRTDTDCLTESTRMICQQFEGFSGRKLSLCDCPKGQAYNPLSCKCELAQPCYESVSTTSFALTQVNQ